MRFLSIFISVALLLTACSSKVEREWMEGCIPVADENGIPTIICVCVYEKMVDYYGGEERLAELNEISKTNNMSIASKTLARENYVNTRMFTEQCKAEYGIE